MTNGPVNPSPGGLPGTPVSLVDRAKNIIVSPTSEWPVVAAERTTVKDLFTNYAMILAAIPAVASLIGSMMFAPRIGNISYAQPIGLIIVMGLIGYGLSLLIVFLMGLLIDAIAPSMGGVKDRVQSYKLAVYATTPVWVAGILNLYPPLGLLALLAYLYVIYLIYTGVGPVLQVPADKRVGFTLVLVLVYIGLVIILSAIVFMVVATAVAGMFLSSGTMMMN